MAELTVQELSKAGIAPVYSAADAAGDNFVNGPRTFVHAKNGDVGSHTVTVQPDVTQVELDTHGPLTIAAISVAVPASAERMFVVPRGSYGGKPLMTWDAVTSITVGVFRLPRGL